MTKLKNLFLMFLSIMLLVACGGGSSSGGSASDAEDAMTDLLMDEYYLDRSQAECVTDYMDSEVDDLGETVYRLTTDEDDLSMADSMELVGESMLLAAGIMECSFSSEEFQDSLDELEDALDDLENFSW